MGRRLVVVVLSGFLLGVLPAAAAAPAQAGYPSTKAAGDQARHDRLARIAGRLVAAAGPLCRGRCPKAVAIEEGEGLNAHARAGTVSVSRSLIDLARSDSQLALVVGHEMAHLLLGHDAADAISLDQDEARDEERQADHLGLYLVARAGYQPREAAELWPRLSRAQPTLVAGRGIHPGIVDRYRSLQHACNEIENKQRTGRPLTPG